MLPKAPTAQDRQVHTAFEEILHAISHGVGALLWVPAIVLLVLKASGVLETTAVSIYGVCGIVLYGASTIYHAAFRLSIQPLLEVVDHAAIYLKIAGSYTPFALLALPKGTGMAVLSFVWAVALAGVAFKFVAHFTRQQRKKYDWLSLGSYIGLGWVGMLVASQLFAGLSGPGFAWLVAGGLCFTVGAGFYAWKSRMFTHTIFHLFVLAGSICHFVAVYGFLLGGRV
ncbi:MAG: PAQR family membrane homeostasis protein TrhA [Parvularcula sp.]